ncbi:MAG: hypothetical protein VX777_07110 [Chlamydiota bacterium]|nr:hypothetical protein [Chlamydiota bacterium]
MIKKWLEWINYGVLIAFAAFLVHALVTEWARPDVINLQEVTVRKTSLPKRAFAQSQQAYDQIGEPILSLQYRPPRMQLPDLKQKLNYYGQNNRPDASSNTSLLHFNIDGTTASVPPSEKLFLSYDKEGGAGTYRFSPNNMETSLWVEAVPGTKEASILVGMYDEDGNVVKTPDQNASFKLKEKEFSRFGGKAWEIGKWRVDGTLLARQRARWYGVDKFLERHGGEEYKDIAGKSRIEFNEGDDKYSVFVGEGSALIWNGESWESVIPGEESRGYPLLFVKKVDERLMNLELWDSEGKKKIALNLLKSMETWMPQNLQQEFKFLGARTRSQFVFEVDDEKMLLSPHDWLLLTEEGWVKLNTLDEIDDYVDLRERGTLFVFDGITRVGDQQVLRGEMFNPTRTKVHDIELPVQKDGLVFQQVEKDTKKRQKRALSQKPDSEYVNGKERRAETDIQRVME